MLMNGDSNQYNQLHIYGINTDDAGTQTLTCTVTEKETRAKNKYTHTYTHTHIHAHGTESGENMFDLKICM